jgi:vacuolar protein sorting-associated protein 52
MWDRFSGQSTPAAASPPQSRNYSPAPRQTSNLARATRPGLGLYASTSTTSLDLSANTSNTSLPSNARLTNGSSLRQEQRPPPDAPDPVEVLRRILGSSKDGQSAQLNGHAKALLEEKTSDIDFGVLSLQEYAVKEIAGTEPANRVTFQESHLRNDRKQYEDLHASVIECDDVLKSVEAYLTNFQVELGQVSAEIESLQSRSVELNAKLENRRKVEKLLGPAVEEISVSPITVRTITEGAVDENFVMALNEVETRSAALEAKGSETEPAKALQDVKPLLDDLKARAIERIRDFIVAQIKALRSPNINAQLIQQQTFIKYKDLYAFLARNHAVLSEEIGQAYINTMKWYYQSNFSRYRQALDKLALHTIDSNDAMGADPAPARRNVLSGSKAAPVQHDTFNVGRRGDVVKSNNANAITLYLAEENKGTHYLEIPFRNFNQALMDNVSAEYGVVTELFSTNSFQQVSRKVVEIFEPTFAMGHALTKHLVENTVDCLGVLLCVRLNQHFAFELQRRKVPVADSYINYTNILLWPRFQQIMDVHCESLRRISAPASRGAVAAFSLVGGNDASKASLAPHAVTQKFGQFMQSILALSAEAGDDEPVSNSLTRLRSEYEALMSKLAKGVGDGSKRGRFLSNNYSLVMTIISDTQGKLAEEQKEHFSDLLKEVRGK